MNKVLLLLILFLGLPSFIFSGSPTPIKDAHIELMKERKKNMYKLQVINNIAEQQ